MSLRSSECIKPGLHCRHCPLYFQLCDFLYESGGIHLVYYEFYDFFYFSSISPILSLPHIFIFSHILNYTNICMLFKYLAICAIKYVFSFMYLALLTLNRYLPILSHMCILCIQISSFSSPKWISFEVPTLSYLFLHQWPKINDS